MQTLFSNPPRSSRVSRALKAAGFTLGSLCATLSPTLHAQSDDWWFDVEVIVFKRLIDGSQLNESFAYEIKPVDLRQAMDLIGEHLSPDTSRIEQLLPLCYHNPNTDIQLPLQTVPAFRVDATLFAPQHIVFATPSVLAQRSNPFSALEEQAAVYGEFEQIQQSEEREQKQTQEQANYQEEPSLESLQMAFSMPEDAPVAVTQTTEIKAETGRIDTGLAKTETKANRQADTAQNTLDFIVNELNQDGATLAQSGEIREPEAQMTSVENSPVANASFVDELTAQQEAHEVQEADFVPRFAPELLQSEPASDTVIKWQMPSSIACRFEEQAPVAVPFPDSVPNPLLGVERHDVQSPYLLPSSELKMRKLAKDLSRKRDIEGLLHVAWRQRVEFEKENAVDFRLFAGKNFSDAFTYEGYPIAAKQDEDSPLDAGQNAQEGVLENSTEGALSIAPPLNLVDEIEQALAALEQADNVASEQATSLPVLDVPLVPEHLKPEQVWELDGRFKLYLQNIGRVPYLHIDSHLNYRQPMILDDMLLPEAFRSDALAGEGSAQPDYFLKPYPFMQLRRVISNQIHYFDHPMFGMVVQIRRYRLPSFMR